MPSSSYTGLDVLLAAVCGFFALLSLFFCLIFLREIIRGSSSYSWRETAGKVTEIEEAHGERNRSLTYEYMIDGVVRHNDKISYAGDQALDDQATASLAQDATTTVFYNPLHPEQSVLRRGVDPLLFFWSIFPFLIAVTLGSFAVGLLTASQKNATTMTASLNVFVTTWLILFTLLPSVFAVLLTRSVAKGIQSASWPTVQGTILSSDIVETKNWESPNFRFSRQGWQWRSSFSNILRYEYRVEDTIYQQNRIDFGVPLFPTLQNIMKRAADYQAGSSVTIHYNPHNPAEAVLETGAGIYAYLYLGLSLVLTLGVGIPLYRRLQFLFS